ncbi:PH domain-containing protein [Lapidilactobacillus wuchangensis]|uniref:PH domain-containing protein n=1 Tax=Lapidilactobacillus wuchangensis TaxID=2486001 RepID=UPI000F7A7805|nr:PH domain-containing protein [Lapidilactobacillus wuchangensis]
MISEINPYVAVIDQMNGFPDQTDLTQVDESLRIAYQTREASLYLTMQQVLTKLKDQLRPEEMIINLMPITNENGSQVATNGYMGMYAAKSTAGENYIKTQKNLRGNRLLVFTDQRIIFLILVEFIDDPSQFFSYDYDKIKAIKLKEHRASEPAELAKPWKRKHYKWFTLDFQTEDLQVFTETLDVKNAKLFKRNLLTIPGMKAIEISRYVRRKNVFQFIFSNTNFMIKFIQIFWILVVLGGLITVLHMYLTYR